MWTQEMHQPNLALSLDLPGPAWGFHSNPNLVNNTTLYPSNSPLLLNFLCLQVHQLNVRNSFSSASLNPATSASVMVRLKLQCPWRAW